MIDWTLPPDLQEKYDSVVTNIRKLQAELGVTPMTLEERAAAYEARRIEDARKQEELKQLEHRIGRMRPPPKWKV